MKKILLALVLMATPALAANADLYALYAGGRYEDAMRSGAAARNAYGYAIAARAAMADAVLRDVPCMDCLKRGEAFARKAVAADPGLADGHVWLAVSLGYQARITGPVMARLRDAPGQSKAALDAALKSEAANPYAVSALGGWHIEIVRGGGAYLARILYGATEAQAIALFDRAVKIAPDNVAVHYQIALSLAGFDPEKYRARIDTELTAAMRATPDTSYERAMQARAGDLLAALKRGNRDGLDEKVRKFQGYPG